VFSRRDIPCAAARILARRCFLGSAESFIYTLALGLRETGYLTWTTPFGYFCESGLSVYGEILAKICNEIY